MLIAAVALLIIGLIIGRATYTGLKGRGRTCPYCGQCAHVPGTYRGCPR